MMNLIKKIVCLNFFLFAFNASADTQAVKQNENYKGQTNPPNTVAIHFGPGPNLSEKPASDNESRSRKDGPKDGKDKQNLKN